MADKRARGEDAAVEPYLRGEAVRHRVDALRLIDPADGRVLFEPVVAVVSADQLVLASASGGRFRPHWDVLTWPFGQLEPPAGLSDGAVVVVPTTGRRTAAVVCVDPASATRLADELTAAIRDYQRDRMGLA